MKLLHIYIMMAFHYIPKKLFSLFFSISSSPFLVEIQLIFYNFEITDYTTTVSENHSVQATTCSDCATLKYVFPTGKHTNDRASIYDSFS